MNPAPIKGKIPSTHRIKRTLADGSSLEYLYAWRGGPRIDPAGDILEQQRAAIERVRAAQVVTVKPKRSHVTADIQDALRIALKRVLDNTKGRAVKKGRECTIDKADIERMLEKQGWRCAVSGLMFDLSFDAERKFAYNPYGISIDRIDCAGGYTRNNIRLVLTAVNFALNEWGEEVHLRIARAVVARDLMKDAS